MKLANKLVHIIQRRLCRFFDKAINTVLWLFTPNNKLLLLNGWVLHRGKRVFANNFGDDINYIIVSYLSNRRVISYNYSYVSGFKPVNHMCIGSIVDYLTNNQTIIWGSGAIGFNSKMKGTPKKVYAVRGPKTRDYLLGQGVDCPEVYGDPALLLPHIYTSAQKKRYKIGLIPHIVDLKNSFLTDFKKKIGEDCVIIDFAHYVNWRDVVDTINQCEIIASSSLHGLIISDAYEIPNVWIKLSDMIIGEGFKYYDYFLGVGRACADPICFVNRELNYEDILISAKKWTPIKFDSRKLLKACPFLVQKNEGV